MWSEDAPSKDGIHAGWVMLLTSSIDSQKNVVKRTSDNHYVQRCVYSDGDEGQFTYFIFFNRWRSGWYQERWR